MSAIFVKVLLLSITTLCAAVLLHEMVPYRSWNRRLRRAWVAMCWVLGVIVYASTTGWILLIWRHERLNLSNQESLGLVVGIKRQVLDQDLLEIMEGLHHKGDNNQE